MTCREDFFVRKLYVQNGVENRKKNPERNVHFPVGNRIRTVVRKHRNYFLHQWLGLLLHSLGVMLDLGYRTEQQEPRSTKLAAMNCEEARLMHKSVRIRHIRTQMCTLTIL